MRLFPIFFFISFLCFGQSIDQRRDSIIQVGLDCYFKKDTIGLKKSNQLLKEIHESHTDSLSLAKIYHFKALKFRIQYQLDSSYYYYHLSKNISKQIKDSLEVGRRLLSMAYMQNDERDYVGAEVTAIEGLRYLEPLNEIRYTVDFHNILGNILTNISEYKDARKSFNRAEEISNKSSNHLFKKQWKLHILNNIGNTYLLEGTPKKALTFLKKGLDTVGEEINTFPNQYQSLLGNYADCLYLIGIKEDAWKHYYNLLKFREEKENIFGQSLSHNGIAQLFLEEGNRVKAKFHAQKGYELAKSVNNNTTRLLALLKLGELTNGIKSKQYYQEYAQLNDSLNYRERYLKGQFAKVRYETEKKDKENVGLKLENSEKQAELESERLQKVLFALIGVLAIIISITYFRNRRKKLIYKAQLQKIEATEEERTRERNRISQELHDGILSRLFATRMRMGFLEFETEKEFKKQHQSFLDELQSVEKEIRDVSHKLSNNFNSSHNDFIMSIHELLKTQNSLGDFQYKFHTDSNILWEKIGEEIKENIYRILQESIQNTIKHAKASWVFIDFLKIDKNLIIKIKDDGVGFNTKEDNGGIGIKNIHARVENLGGEIKFFPS